MTEVIKPQSYAGQFSIDGLITFRVDGAETLQGCITRDLTAEDLVQDVYFRPFSTLFEIFRAGRLPKASWLYAETKMALAAFERDHRVLLDHDATLLNGAITFTGVGIEIERGLVVLAR